MAERVDSIDTDPVRAAWETSRLSSVMGDAPDDSSAISLKDVPRVVYVAGVIAGCAASDFVAESLRITKMNQHIGPAEAELIGGAITGAFGLFSKAPRVVRGAALAASACLLVDGINMVRDTLSGNKE